MRSLAPLSLVLAALLMAPQGVAAHDPQEFTFLLREDGSSPSSVEAGILVETDSIFFMNVDDREGVSHRVEIDADGDGYFEFATQWLNASCERDANGSKVNEGCMVTELVLLAPENGLLPGNISMMHQISSNSGISSRSFYVNYALDVHSPPTEELPTGSDEEHESGDGNGPLVLLLLASLIGISIILPRLMDSTKEK